MSGLSLFLCSDPEWAARLGAHINRRMGLYSEALCLRSGSILLSAGDRRECRTELIMRWQPLMKPQSPDERFRNGGVQVAMIERSWLPLPVVSLN